MIKKTKATLAEDDDENLWIIVACRCGNIVYRNNLEDGKIQLLVRGKFPKHKYSNLHRLGVEPSQITISCCECDTEHPIITFHELFLPKDTVNFDVN